MSLAAVVLEPLTYVSGPGAPSDTAEMTVNGSETPAIYRWRNDGTWPATITRIALVMQGAGGADGDKYGDLTKLTNGCLLEFLDSTGEIVKTFGPIKRNADFFLVGGDLTQFAGDVWSKLIWDTAGQGLSVAVGESIQYRIRDNLSTLSSHRILLSGQAPIPAARGSVNR